MTSEEFDKYRKFVQSPDQEHVLMAYQYIVSDKRYEEAKRLFAKTQIDNSTCPSLGNTIADVCALLERVLNDNSFMKSSWPVLRESLYSPAGICLLDTLKNYLVKD